MLPFSTLHEHMLLLLLQGRPAQVQVWNKKAQGLGGAPVRGSLKVASTLRFTLLHGKCSCSRLNIGICDASLLSCNTC